MIDKKIPSLNRAVVFVGDHYSQEFNLYKSISLLENEGQKFNYFTLDEEDCKKQLGVTKEPSLLMFRNKFNTKPAVFNGQFLKESILPWLWNTITPPGF